MLKPTTTLEEASINAIKHPDANALNDILTDPLIESMNNFTIGFAAMMRKEETNDL